MNKIEKIDRATKASWDENWHCVSMDRVMEILDYPRVREQVGYFLRYIKINDLILEGGCGLAPYVIHFADRGYNIVGLDYNVSCLRKAREHSRVRLLAANVDRLPFKDESFDCYLSLGVIEHFANGPDDAIREAYRVLKPGGFFLCQVPARNIYRFFDMPLRFFKRNGLIRTMLGKPKKNYYWEQYFGIKKLTRMLEGAGFSTKEIIRFSYSHALISSFPFLRKKGSYDAASDTAIRIAAVLKIILPAMTAGENLFVVQKRTN